MRKYDFISALAKETAAEVVKNREEWMKYLTRRDYTSIRSGNSF